MRKPRLWSPGIVYELTLRTEHRMFLLKPDIDTKNILGSSLGRALKRFPVQLHAFDSNITFPGQSLVVFCPDLPGGLRMIGTGRPAFRCLSIG